MSWGKFKKGGTRYGNTKIEGPAGHWFDSRLEKSVFSLLSLTERAGEIRDLSHHPGTVFLTRARIQYRPDFRFVNCATGETEYAEAKGFPNDLWPLKKKLWQYYGPGKLTIYMGRANSPRVTEVIVPKGGSDE